MPCAKRCGVTMRSATHDSRHLLAERAQDLVDPVRRPDVEERRALERHELVARALPRLLRAFAGSRRTHVRADRILVVDGWELDVAMELPEVLRQDHGDGQRRPLAAGVL